MPSELPRPNLADTPDLFDRIETGLRREASQIRERHLARQRRRRWFFHLRPVMSAGAAIAVAVVLIPLAQSPSPMTATTVLPESVEERATTATTPFMGRIPTRDYDLLAGSPEPQPADDHMWLRDLLPAEDLAELST